jgi:hypothetical protein
MRGGRQCTGLSWALGKSEDNNFWRYISPCQRVCRDAPVTGFSFGSIEFDDIANRSVNHPGVDQTAMKELESGVFSLHLDTVFPIADFYQVSRKDMLNCVLRTFFREEYQMLITTKNSK